jgi:hypothetical protein
MGVSRAAFELEKKVNAEQLEQRQSMEKNLVSMARDLEKLRAEQTNAENRARVHNSGVALYNGGYPVQDVTYATMPQQVYGDGYSMHPQVYPFRPWLDCFLVQLLILSL